MASKRKTKKVSAPKSNKPSIPVEGSHGLSSSNLAIPVSSNPMVRGTVDGVGVWRQPSLKNEYNPEGITLAVVDHELADARIVKEYKDWKVIELWHGRSNRPVSDEDRGVIIKIGFCKDLNFSAIPQPEPLQCLTRHMMLSSHQCLIEDDDAYFASLIRESPEALIMLTGAQEAWARWSYASHWGKEKSTTDEAKIFISYCQPKTRGRRPLHQFDNKLLLRAYDDCCAYIRCLYKCAKVLRDPKQVSELFPDAKQLENFGKKSLACFNIKLDMLTKPGKPRHAASDVAAAYIAQYYGLSDATVMNKISEVRGKSRKPKPA